MTVQPESVQVSSMTPAQIRTNRIKLIGIFAVALVPVVLAISMYFGGFGLPDQKTNKGDLIWPPIAISTLGDDTDSAKQVIETSPNWYLVMTTDQRCQNQCEQALHMMRQVNVALGREMERVSRLLVSPDIQTAKTYAEAYPKLKYAQADQTQISAFMSSASLPVTEEQVTSDWSIWLVDPLGNVIMKYGAEHDGYDIKADLKKLLKLSNIG